MSKYRICWWEDNGYHDSYFYGVYYDDATENLHEISLGATAYAGGIGFTDEYLMPTPEVAEKARLILKEYIYASLFAADRRDVNTPFHSIVPGRRLVLIADHSFFRRETEPCRKCNGTGYWVNPRKDSDKRECFGCRGKGVRVGGYVHAHGSSGKRVKETLKAGTKVEARSEPLFYGTTYRNGYNRPMRGNTSVQVVVDDQAVKIPTEKLSLDRPYAAEAALDLQAEQLSHEHNYGAVFGCKAWMTENWAKQAAKVS